MYNITLIYCRVDAVVINNFKKQKLGWEDGSAAENKYCSSGEPRFSSQDPHQAVQSVTLALRDLTSGLLGSLGLCVYILTNT